MPQIPLEQIHISFAIEPPKDNRSGIIITYINYFSKMVVLAPLRESDAQIVASSILAQAVSHPRSQASIINNRDPRF